jgi:hypothetical protein
VLTQGGHNPKNWAFLLSCPHEQRNHHCRNSGRSNEAQSHPRPVGIRQAGTGEAGKTSQTISRGQETDSSRTAGTLGKGQSSKEIVSAVESVSVCRQEYARVEILPSQQRMWVSKLKDMEVVRKVNMFKTYISRWAHREKPEEHKIDYGFCSDAVSAAFWETEEDAQNDAVIFERHHIVIHSAQGIPHICSGFKIEQRAPNEFVIFYEVPFLPVAAASPVDTTLVRDDNDITAS